MKETALFKADNEKIFYLHSESPHCNVDIHLHDSYEIFMALSSNILYHIEGNAYSLNKGDVVITNEKEIHKPLISHNGKYERQFIQFSPSIFTHFFSDTYNPLKIFENRQLGQNNKITFSNPKENAAIEIFAEIEMLSKSQSQKNQIIIKTLLIKLLTELEDRYQASLPSARKIKKQDERIEAVIDDLNNNYNKPFCLDAISRNHFMDKYYLCHLFKKTTGFTLVEYLQSKRIQSAKMLISQGIGIMEAARLSGFSEYSNFYKTFSQLVKMPPKKYRDHLMSAKIL